MNSNEFAIAFEKLNRMVPDRAVSATVHLFAAKSDKKHLYPFGTGTLLSIGDRRLVVTAAHVRTEQKKHGLDFLCAGTRKGTFTPLIQSNWYLHPNFDVAIFDLTTSNVDAFAANEFLTLADVAFDVDATIGIFAIFGLPAKWSEASLDDNGHPVTAKALQFITYPYTESLLELPGFDPAIHIALNASETDHRNIDGKELQWPEPIEKFLPGISGCGIWKLCHEFDPIAIPDASKSRLVGVETSVFSKARVIKGTKWGAVAALIRTAFPALQPSFEIAWPA
jgi:hypothetical protein